MALKNAIASGLIIALGLILIIHFTLFWVYGGVFIYEGNKIILSVETAMSVAVLAFGLERLATSSGCTQGRREAAIRDGRSVERDGSTSTATSDSPRMQTGTAIPATATSSTPGLLGIAPLVVESGCSSTDGWASGMTDRGPRAGGAPVPLTEDGEGSPRQRRRVGRSGGRRLPKR